jgi:peptidoglycan/xylan/chitin deacetylase (PgdA/CDA1 family)
VVYFHHVSTAIDHYTSLTPDSFRYGLDLLLSSFKAVSLDDLTGGHGSFTVPGEPAVVITFDDGYADLLDDAVPALAEREVRAVFFLCTEFLGRRSADPRKNYLSWPEAADLAAAGHTIGSHGRSHQALTGLGPDEARQEITGSLSDLRAHLGLGIRHPSYAYPYGKVGPVPDTVDGFDGPLTAFGTVKSPPLPWPRARAAIRRTYLPTGDEATWQELVARWRRNWDAAQ